MCSVIAVTVHLPRLCQPWQITVHTSVCTTCFTLTPWLAAPVSTCGFHCLPHPAALCVLHAQVSGLHSHAAQRLVGLTSLLARRWLKLSQAMAGSGPNQDIQVGGGGRYC
jgi:hypothetical protein